MDRTGKTSNAGKQPDDSVFQAIVRRSKNTMYPS